MFCVAVQASFPGRHKSYVYLLIWNSATNIMQHRVIKIGVTSFFEVKYGFEWS